MAQANPFDQFDTAAKGPLPSPPPKPDKPSEKTTYRPLTPEEVAARGLPTDQQWQLGSDGRVDPITSKNANATEDQRKNSMFYGRMLKAEKDFAGVPEDSRDPRAYAGQILHDTAPDLENSLPTWLGGNSDQRQVADRAARDFIAATLRIESGAAIGKDEFDKQYRIFFPMPGDGPDVIKAKAEARRQAMEGFRISAGSLAAETEKKFNENFGQGASSAGVNAPPSGGQGGPSGGGDGPTIRPEMRGGLPVGTDVQFNMDKQEGPWDRNAWLMRKYGITPDQETTLAATLNANINQLTPERVNEIYDSLKIPRPDPQVVAQQLEQIKQGKFPGFGNFDDSEDRKAYTDSLQSNLNERGFDPTSGGAYLARGARGLEFGLSDEIEGLGAAAKATFNLKNPVEAYIRERDTQRLAEDQMRDKQGLLGYGAELAGGALTAKFLPASPVKGGAVAGALSGFGNGNGLVGSLTGAAAGGVLGRLTGKAVEVAAPYVGRATGRVGEMLGVGRSNVPTEAADLIAAGERQNIPIRKPDFDMNARAKMAELESTEAGGNAINRVLASDKNAIEARVGEIGGAGANSVPYDLGTQVQKAGERYINQSRGQASALYRRADDLANGARVRPNEVDAAIEGQIAELTAQGANTNAAQIAYLNGLKSDLDKAGGFTADEFQGLMSAAKAKIRGDQALTSSDASRRLGIVVDAFEADAKRDLPAEAYGALSTANKFYRERQDFINGVLKDFMGNKGNPVSAETAAARLIAMAKSKGNADKFGAMWKKLEPDEQADVAATIAGALGRKTNGEFSPDILIKSLDPRNGISQRTAKLVFGDKGAAALQDLREIALAKQAAQSERNFTKSGIIASKAQTGLRRAVIGMLGFGAGGPAGAVGGVATEGFLAKLGQERAARLLMNPVFTKAIKSAPQSMDQQAVNGWFSKLGKIAIANPTIANDVDEFVNLVGQRLVSQSPVNRAAAEDQNQ